MGKVWYESAENVVQHPKTSGQFFFFSFSSDIVESIIVSFLIDSFCLSFIELTGFFTSRRNYLFLAERVFDLKDIIYFSKIIDRSSSTMKKIWQDEYYKPKSLTEKLIEKAERILQVSPILIC